MKKFIIIITGLMLFSAAHSQKLYIGVRSGAGAMLTQSQLKGMQTSDGFRDVVTDRSGWSIPFKAEALLGLGPFRLGYQFMYNYAHPTITAVSFAPSVTDGQNTTYFNASKTHIYAHYFLGEISLINTSHFGLVPGIAVGSYNGYRVDRTTGERVPLAQVTNRRFSVGAQLNAEIKFGRVVFLFGPNYYLFSLQDKANSNWREYQHFIGADLGLRVNLLKP